MNGACFAGSGINIAIVWLCSDKRVCGANPLAGSKINPTITSGAIMSVDYFSSTKPKDMMVFPLTIQYQNDLDDDELGRLVAAFNVQFAFYNLIVHKAIANADSGSYHLYVTRGATNHYAPAKEDHCDFDKGISKEDEAHFQSFVAGFTHGLRAFRKNKFRKNRTRRY